MNVRAEYPVRVLCLFTIMNRGGAETMCMNLYRHMEREKIQFDFLVYYPEKGIYEDEIKSMGGRVFRIPHPSNLLAHISAARTFFHEHPEYRIVHNHMQSNGALICAEAKKAGVPTIIYHSHSGALPILTKDYKLTLRRARNRLLNHIAINNSTFIFACGAAAANTIPADRTVLPLNNAVDLQLFRFSPQIREIMRKQLGCDDKLVIGHVGRFDSNKNQAFAIDVFEEVIKKEPNAELWLIGDGVQRQQIEQRVKKSGLEDKVRLLGIREDIPRLLQAMDAFLFPSIAEGLPVSCIEAQAAGLPCIFSAGFDPTTVITDHCRILSLKESPERWADTVLRMKNKERKDTFSELKSAGYDIEETSRQMEEFYLSREL